MKKFVMLLAAVCIIAVAVFTVVNTNNPVADTKSPMTAEAAGTTEETAPEKKTPIVDYEAMKTAFAPDTVVAKVGNKEITWDSYYNWVCFYAQQVESNIQMYTNYGYDISWEDVADPETNRTYIDLAMEAASDYVKQINSVILYAENKGIVNEENEAVVQEEIAKNIAAVIGEEGTDEQFEEFLDGRHMSRQQYDDIIRFNAYYDILNKDMYGENGEKISDERAMEFLNENGYMYANHILFLTTNMATGEEMTAEDIEAAYAKACEIAAELQAIEDNEERLARFLELKEELDEDTGKVSYPNGYTFKDGEMVEPFYNGAKESAEYQVTDPIQSSYGYHIIIRLPLDPDAGIPNQQNMSARQVVAQSEFTDLMNKNYEDTVVELTDEAQTFNLANYLK